MAPLKKPQQESTAITPRVVWSKTEQSVGIYLQGRYLPPLYFLFRAIGYLLTHQDEAKAAQRAFVDWIELVDLLHKRAPKTSRRLNEEIAAEMGKRFKGHALDNAVFATGRAVRHSARTKRPPKDRLAPKAKSPLAGFVGAFGFSYGLLFALGLPSDYAKASLAASRRLLKDLALAAEDRLVLEKLVRVTADLAQLLKKTTQPFEGDDV